MVNASPAEFIDLIRNATFVVTNSFHATAFSIIFRKNFINILSAEPERAKTLLSRIGLNDRIVSDLDQVKTINMEVNYTGVEEKLKIWRDESVDFLTGAI
jgi:hypothetical protein